MNSDWQHSTVGDIAEFENRHRVPLSGAQRAERAGIYPYWGANGPFDAVDDYLFDGTRVLVAEDGNTVVRPDGRGTVHWATGRYWVNNHAHVLNVRADNDLRWLFYALSISHVRDFVTGSAQPKLSMGSLKQVPLRVPPVVEQRQIATVLGALDDKIDSNRRLTRLLEETAATLFQARFVDFVGINDFEDSEIGRIPHGWRLETLSDIATPSRQTIRPSEFVDETFEHFSIPAYDDGRESREVPGAELLSGKSLLPNLECVLLSKLNPTTRRIWWPRPDGRWRAVCSPEFLVLVPKTVPTTYLYVALTNNDRFYAEFLGHATGTTGSRQRVKPQEALRCRIVRPDDASLNQWDEVVRPLYDQSASLAAESATLAALRDVLLPKLISGQIRVTDTADADEVIEPALA